MRKFSQYLFLWALGGILYYAIELLFRGFSHWSMFLLGGLCMVFFAVQQRAVKWQDPIWVQVIRCTIFITACEFITGMIVNKWMGWEVWDYSDQPFQIFGQVCMPFMVLFSGLAAMGIILSGYLMYWLFGGEKPQYHVL